MLKPVLDNPLLKNVDILRAQKTLFKYPVITHKRPIVQWREFTVSELRFRLREDMVVEIKFVDGQVLTIVVPKGFVSDGASVPWFFWKIVPPFGNYLRAAVVHDYLYRVGCLSRRVADAVLWSMAIADKTPKWQMRVIDTGLAIGGGPAYRRYEALRDAGVDTVLWGDLKRENQDGDHA